MSEYELVNDQFKDKWINKPNNLGDVGDLQDITDELNNLLRERDEARGERCSIQCAFEESQDKIEELERERDEAIIKCESETPWGANNESKESWFERQREKYKILERERDEAKKENVNLRKLLKKAQNGLYELGDYDLANELINEQERAR